MSEPYSPEKKVLSHRNVAKWTHEMLMSQLQKDPLTGLENFRALEAWLKGDEKRQEGAGRSRIDEKQFDEGRLPLYGVVVFMDVDGLGEANKTSHEEGDRLIISVANAARSLAQRAGDVAFRRGDRSDEIVVILPGAKFENFLKLNRKFKKNLSTGSASIAFGTYGYGVSARESLNKLDKILSQEKAKRKKGQHIKTIFVY